MIVVVQSREKFLADKEKAYQAGLRKGRADRIEALEAENERLQKQLDRRIVDGIHTCHDECPRLLCVERRENKRLREALEQFFALIEHQYFGSREAMNALQEADNAARAALGEKQ